VERRTRNEHNLTFALLSRTTVERGTRNEHNLTKVNQYDRISLIVFSVFDKKLKLKKRNDVQPLKLLVQNLTIESNRCAIGTIVMTKTCSSAVNPTLELVSESTSIR